MSLGAIVERAFHSPLDETLRWIGGALRRRAQAWRRRRLDRSRPTYAPDQGKGALGRYLTLDAADVPPSLTAALGPVAAHILSHRFDLLGSGWTPVFHGVQCRGLDGVTYPSGPSVEADPDGAWLEPRINTPNRAEAQRLWRMLGDPAYRPIDWQLDFKSGYRWSARAYFLDIKVGPGPGADVKLPWELARMQHLPWLATAYLLALGGRDGFRPADDYRREIRSQILDFLSANPPRFGVHWRSPMDVAIRIANWLVALDILRAAGAELDGHFLAIVERAALEHGRHIADHLEWSDAARGNHYLANIVGLLFVAAYLPRRAETDAWLAFGVQELAGEIDVQFLDDGGSFEASTSYHCLSAELAIYGAALVLGLPPEKLDALAHYDRRAVRLRPPFAPAPMPFRDLPGGGRSPLAPRMFERLATIVAFAEAVHKPSRQIHQVGDADSGRLFKFHPAWHVMSVAEAKGRYASLSGYESLPGDAPYWDEDMLDRRALLAASGTVLGDDKGVGPWLDAAIVHALARGRSVHAVARSLGAELRTDLGPLLAGLGRLPDADRRTMDIPLPTGSIAGLEIRAFPAFGLYILRSARLFIALRCADGRTVPPAPRGHGHDDNLALEIEIDGRGVLTDPGSYLYTPALAMRNRYRAAAAHAVPRPSHGSQAATPAGTFDLVQRARGVALHCGTDGLAGRLDGPGWTAWRVVELLPGLIRITDAATPGPLAPFPPDPPLISLGYGKHTQDPARSV